MTTDFLEPVFLHEPAEIECGHCKEKLPLRLSKRGESGAVWLCAECSIPFVSICMRDQLADNAATIKLDDRYFSTEGLPEISPKVRREVARLAERANTAMAHEQRRSERVSQSLVVPAVKLDGGLNPAGNSFQVMVANVSQEGIGLVHNDTIDAQHIALKLPLDEEEPIQVVVKIVRERELERSLREFGGEFFVRLGSTLEEE